MPIKLAVLVSGRGSNLEAILDAITRGELDAVVQLVLSNNPEAPACDIARRFGVPCEVVANAGLSRTEHEEILLRRLSTVPIDYVVLAGYMRILTSNFLRHFADPAGFYRVINIHPSLLPAFPGKSAYADAFEHGVRVSGITVHLVDDLVDHGPILAQQAFPRLENDSLESFQCRGLEIEHRLYPAVLQQIAREGVRLLPVASRVGVAQR